MSAEKKPSGLAGITAGAEATISTVEQLKAWDSPIAVIPSTTLAEKSHFEEVVCFCFFAINGHETRRTSRRLSPEN